MRILAGSALALALLAPLAGGAERWVRSDGPHLRVYSERNADAAAELHAFLAALDSLLGVPAAVRREPCATVILHAGRGAVEEAARKVFRGGGADVAGFAVPSPKTTYVVAGDARRVYGALARVYAAAHFPSMPRWLETGLVETLRTAGRDRQREHMSWLKRNPAVDLKSVLAAADGRLPAGMTRETFEAISWALTQSLLEREELRRSAAGSRLDPSAAASAVRVWIETGTIAAAPRRRARAQAAAPRAVGHAEVLVEVGNAALYGGGDRPAAMELYRQAVASDPGDATARAMLGLALEESGAVDEALPHLEAATRAGVSDPAPYLVYAHLLLERNAARHARSLLQTALTLDDTNTDAWAAHCRTFIHDQTGFDEALASCERSLSLDPRNQDAALSLVLLHLKKNDLPRAVATLDQHLRSIAEAPILHAAERAVVAWKLHRADELARVGDLAAAKRLVAEVLTVTTDPTERHRLQSDLQQLELTAETVRLTEVYNRAVAAFNEGRPAQARTLVEQVLREARDPALRRDAEKLKTMLE